MLDETFMSAGQSFPLSIYPAPLDGKRHPVVILLHGNFGLSAPYGDQIHSFADALAKLGYLAAVPRFYQDDRPHWSDITPFDRALTDAANALVGRQGADPERLGLIGFSLGAATAMTFTANSPLGTVKALADFFGFLTPAIRDGLAKFPPTIIFHNKNDNIVPVEFSEVLARTLPSAIAREFVPYDEQWQKVNHAFQPGGTADTDSRARTLSWFSKHLPPTGS